MDAVEYLKVSKRICGAHETCEGCPLNRENYENDCTTLEHTVPEMAVSIVEAWNKAHTVLTRKDVLLKVYPDAEMKEGVPTICPRSIAGGACRDYRPIVPTFYESCMQCKMDYWGQEV